MGTFEKLGILVIVVIIVMILAVAIYQWGGAGTMTTPTTTVVGTSGPELTVKRLEELMEQDKQSAPPTPEAGKWPGGIPKSYRIERDDKMWVLVVKRWQLKDSFLQAIEQANPKIDFKRLKPGTDIAIPDPAAYTRTAAEKQAPPKPSGSRLYEVRGGDTLESIAFQHLGAKTRWPDIMTMNPGLEPKRLSEGQEIYLPVK
jgi:nucleoid-associated protein YgaU